MNNIDPKKTWEAYCANEIKAVSPILHKNGITLEDSQPHIQGERYLMQAMTTASGKKLILLGKTQGGTRVVIKVARGSAGRNEIIHERTCREILARIDFAGAIFNTPQEIFYSNTNDCTIIATEFIEQESTFLERPLAQQFTFALKAFKGQESAHATTWNHRALIRKVFEIRDKNNYLHTFSTFKANVALSLPHKKTLNQTLEQAYKILVDNANVINQYTGFLTHTDFVPHNIRIKNETIYLLDHSSLTFGNKYEGWARFLNFMTLYNPELENALVTYVAQNRSSEESQSLRMMRIYRLGEIIWYYARAREKSTGDLNQLNTIRITFWSNVLSHLLKDESIPDDLRNEYIKKRDSLRSEDEKRRQRGLH